MMVICGPAGWTLPPLPKRTAFSGATQPRSVMVWTSPPDPRTVAPVRLASSATSPVWSPWPCVTRITSTLPMASRFLYPTGVLGLLTMNGSMTITLPVSVVIFVVACPSHWTSILLVCAQAASAARLKVRAPAPILRKSRRCISMIPSWWLGQRDGVADTDEAVVEDLRPQAPAMNQGRHGALLREAVEVPARLAEPGDRKSVV